MKKSVWVLGWSLLLGSLTWGLDHPVKRKVKGKLQFNDYTTAGTYVGMKPIQYVIVRLSLSNDFALTDSKGRYSKWFKLSTLPAGTSLSANFESTAPAADVWLDLDWGNDRLLWKRTKKVPFGTSPIDLSATVKKSEFSVHFSILSTLTWGRSYALHQGWANPFPAYQVDVEYPDAAYSKYLFFWDEIRLSGPKAYGYGGNSTDDGWNPNMLLILYDDFIEDKYELGFNFEFPSLPH